MVDATLTNDMRMIIEDHDIHNTKKFSYPYDKKPTKQNVAAMRGTETRLDSFWTDFDRLYLDTIPRHSISPFDAIINLRPCSAERSLLKFITAGGSIFSSIVAVIKLPRNPIRTPEWQAPPVQKPRVRGDNLVTQPLADMHFDLHYRTERTIEPDVPFRKIIVSKTKDSDKENLPNNLAVRGPVLETTEVVPGKPVYKVSKRALKVFHTLFFTPSPDATAGAISWKDFLCAMTHAGFAAYKQQGSAWHFIPTDSSLIRSIHFHEPHPSDKIAFWTARHFGRRLNRTYGWTNENFMLADAKAVTDEKAYNG